MYTLFSWLVPGTAVCKMTDTHHDERDGRWLGRRHHRIMLTHAGIKYVGRVSYRYSGGEFGAILVVINAWRAIRPSGSRRDLALPRRGALPHEWRGVVMGRRGVSALGMIVALVGGMQDSSSAVRAETASGADAATSTGRTGTSETFGNLPLYFVENRGQLDSRVAYSVQGRDASVFFTPQGVTFALSGSTPYTLKLDFVGAAREVRPTGRDATSATVSYFKGGPDRWATGLETYSSVVYRDLWPGIDLVFSGTGSRLKYTFLLAPWADPDQIRLAYRGGTGARLTEAGELEISTPVGPFRDDTPVSYQGVGGSRVEVSTRYTLARDQQADATTYEYGFRLGEYDRSKPLVLDPAFLVYAGFVGGAGDERGLGIALDDLGNAYVAGQTTSSESSFPEVVGPDLTFNGNLDGYVAKLNAAGTALIYAGYIGGAGNDAIFDITVDAARNAYVTGFTTSAQTSFPATVGPDLTFNGNQDTFVAKLNPAGTALVYAGYIGGSRTDFGEGIAVDSTGNAYISGTTDSNQQTFPAAVGPDLTYNGGRFDSYVAKVNAAGTALVYAGYIGGSGNDVPVTPGRGTTISGGHIALDSSGSAYVSGTTTSNHSTFPNGKGFGSLPGPDRTFNGKTDAFVAKVRADGSGLIYAGYIGGAGEDRGFGMAVDSGGNAYLTGDTDSTEATFPVVVGPDLTFNGVIDTFVAKVRADGNGLVYSGYIGGDDGDQGLGVAIHETASGTFLYVVGHTHSTNATFPVAVGPDLTYNGAGENGDAFVAKIEPVPGSPSVTENLVYNTYVGGTGEDAAYWIDVDAAGNAYVTGDTDSNSLTFPDGDGIGAIPSHDRVFNGGLDAFVAKVAEAPPPANDDFANATAITALPFTQSLSTVTATSETGEPSPCGGIGTTVWYSFTSTTDVSISADTLGSNYETTVAAYTGTSLPDLRLLACNDRFEGTAQSRIAFIARAGTSVFFQVGGRFANTGNLTFNVAEGPPPPPNDNFADAAPIVALPFTNSLNTTVATFETGEPALCANARKTVWYAFNPATAVSISANTFGSDFDTVLAAYTGASLSNLAVLACNDQAAGTNQSRITFTAPAGATVYFQVGGFQLAGGNLTFNVTEAPPPPNDSFANATAIAALPFDQSVNTDAATTEVSEPSPCGSIANTVWYSFTATAAGTITANTFGSNYDTVLAAYTGASISNLTLLACNDQPALMKQSRITFAAQAGTNIFFQVGGHFGDTGNLTFNVAEAPPSSNDDFANASPIASLPFSESLSTAGATAEPGEPSPCGGIAKTVWYSFTPSVDISLSANTFGSDFDTVLAAYTGTSLSDLTLVACNDQAVNNQSRVTISATAGATVFFQVGGSQGDSGNLTFSVAVSHPPPVNDNFANAIPVTSLPFTDLRSTLDTTREAGEPTAPCGFVRTVWYSFTPSADVTITADTFGSDYDTVLAAYTGTSLTDLTLVACGNDAAGTTQSQIAIVVPAGTTIFFEVGTLFSAGGNLTFNVAELTGTPPANDRITNAASIVFLPFADSVNTSLATSEVAEPIPCGLMSHTVWYSFTPGANVTITADTFGSNFNTVLAVYTGTSLSNLTLIGCNDQAAGGSQSQISLDATAGTPIFIQAGGSFGNTGNLNVNVS